jgi:hypothetical protein
MVAGLRNRNTNGAPSTVFSRESGVGSIPSPHDESPPKLRCFRRPCSQSIALSGWCKRTDGIEAAQPPARVQYGGGQRPPPTCVPRPTESLRRTV